MPRLTIHIHHLLAFITTAFLLAAVTGTAQIDLNNSPPRFQDRLFFGGSLGLQFGNITLVDVSPMVGYKVTERLGFGISPTYKYYRYRSNYSSSYNFTSNVFGAGLFGRYLIFESIFAHAEYEYLSYHTRDAYVTGSPIANEYQSVLVGGGYREQISDNGYMYLLILWNLNETIDSPYSNPVIRAGFSFGF